MRTLVTFAFGVITGWFLAQILDQQRIGAELEHARRAAIRSRQHLAEAERRRQQAPQQDTRRATIPSPDDLTRIKGIGPVFQQKLYDAGIRTFDQLRTSSPEQLREIVGAAEWQNVEPRQWIDEAAALAEVH